MNDPESEALLAPGTAIWNMLTKSNSIAMA
jgi:hypothetical protein